jgi:hypothetical protein
VGFRKPRIQIVVMKAMERVIQKVMARMWMRDLWWWWGEASCDVWVVSVILEALVG